MTKSKSKSKSEVSSAEEKKGGQKKFRVTTSNEKDEMFLFAKDKKEAEATGEVLFLQHGHYSNENPPVDVNAEEIDE